MIAAEAEEGFDVALGRQTALHPICYARLYLNSLAVMSFIKWYTQVKTSFLKTVHTNGKQWLFCYIQNKSKL